MPRRLRVEYPGAIYHIINRGNYRYSAFREDTTKHAFMACIFEACEKSAWILHAFVVMRNHYHLALETPEGNLVSGMQWLQGTFANRFNRFRDERGHLFQGRYQSILTEHGKSLGEICDYDHFNPVRAHVVPVAGLKEYRHSSYWYLRHKSARPRFLRPQTALECAGGIPDTPEGWGRYDQHLELVERLRTTSPHGGKEGRPNLCRGWAIGSDEFKSQLMKKYDLTGIAHSSDPVGVAELRTRRWEAELATILNRFGKSREDAWRDQKSAQWKLEVVAWMREHTQASHQWLSMNLNLGTLAAARRNLANYRRKISSTSSNDLCREREGAGQMSQSASRPLP